MAELVDLAELSTIYLSYDEPQADEFWARISAEIPWAVRVHGVHGSDAAHKAAAEASETERFVLIDGDNIPHWDFFNQTLVINDSNRNVVFRWRAQNHINGLTYGNGGLSCWTRDFAQRMRSHEASSGEASTAVEFCFYPDYWAMYDTWSTTYPNGSAKHAWRAGFREGVKMCLDQGTKPSLGEFQQRVVKSNMRNLSIWHSVGRDVKHGIWAIFGARLGTYMAMCTDWDYLQVQDFQALEQLWETVKHHDAEAKALELAAELQQLAGLTICELDVQSSAFFKKHQLPRPNLNVNLREGFEIKYLRKLVNEQL